MFQEQNPIRFRLARDGHRQAHRQSRKGADRAEGQRRVWRSDHVRIGPEYSPLDPITARRFQWADKPERRVIFVAMKILFLERCTRLE